MTAITWRQTAAAAGVLLSVALAAVCHWLGSVSFQQPWDEARCYSLVPRPAAQYYWTWAALSFCVLALACAVWFPRSSAKPASQTLVKGGLLALVALATAVVSLTLAWIHLEQPALKTDEDSCYGQRR